MAEQQHAVLQFPYDARRQPKSFSYFNRELSWIEFNSRVLEEALDPSLPVLERLRFLCIFARNLDEFFMVRVSGLKQQYAAGLKTRAADGRTPAEQLAAISAKLRPLLDRHQACWTELRPRLSAEGIRVLDYGELNAGQKKELADYFAREVFPVLTPLVVDPGHPFPHISNLSLNLGVEVADLNDPRETRFARVKVPVVLPRLVPLPTRSYSFVLLEEVISANIARLFPGMEILSCHPFRITRDADIEIEEEEAEDLLKLVQEELRRRRFGLAVRLQVDARMPWPLQQMLLKVLRLEEQDRYPVYGPLGISDFETLTQIDRPDLKFKTLKPVLSPHLETEQDLFRVVRRGDVLLHHPFGSFEPVVRFIERAAEDPDVLAIKQTLYRTSGESPIIDALIKASENGKQVAVLLELKARFDEESNIQWARKLERVGVHVVYGVLRLKTHCKIALVVRRERDGLRRYVHLSTGNYNPITARVYTDLGLLTCAPDFGADASDLFNFLTGFCRQGPYRKLLVAPHNLRQNWLRLIEEEIAFHGPDNPGHIVIKANAMTDIDLMEGLYRASQAGVRIDLLIRGTCCLRPGVPGLSENIRVTSVVGRFLEHSRIFYLRHGGDEKLYLGSADWMSRNLDRRVETVFPVEDPIIKQTIRDKILGVYLADNVRARLLQPDGTYVRLSPRPDEPLIDCQEILMTKGHNTDIGFLDPLPAGAGVPAG